MPEFARGTPAFAHTLHSALVSLQALGIPAARISLRCTGRDLRAEGTVVRQSPAAGTPLTAATRVHLDLAGVGYTQSLPVGLWDSGGEAEPGTREMLEHFDDPLQKLRHWFHEGAPLFRISPADQVACSRWLALFGIDSNEWPRSLWYRLASVIAAMPEISCTQDGLRFTLDVLLGLPVRTFRHVPALAVLPDDSLSRLGSQASRLGVDLLVGDMVEDLADLELEIGPVPLEVYERFVETAGGERLLQQVLELATPRSVTHTLRWTVGDPHQSPQLGIAAKNGRLGINSHLGSKPLPADSQPWAELAQAPDLHLAPSAPAASHGDA